MAGNTVATMLAFQAIQSVLVDLESKAHYGAHWCPVPPKIEDITSIGSFDYVIVGGGTAGLIVASRLSERLNATILVLEAGKCPPAESFMMGYSVFLSQSQYDYNMTAVNDNRTCQNIQNGECLVTAGKMLGGTGSLNYGFNARGSPQVYDDWAAITNDSSWSYDQLLPYFKKSENLQNTDINEEFGDYHGTSGPLKLKQHSSPYNAGVFHGLANIGTVWTNDTNNNITYLGVTEPLIQVGDGIRQSSLVSYFYPVKGNSNLYVLTDATASKIVFDSDNVATGVEFIFNDTTYTVNADREVIVSAGAIKTPQLLMLSGIGPADHLNNLNITVVSDLPVGNNLQDHMYATLAVGLNTNDSTIYPLDYIMDPREYPAPTTINYNNMSNSLYSSINLYFTPDSSVLKYQCTVGIQYSDSICQKVLDVNAERNVMLLLIHKLQPNSRGTVRLNTTNIDDQPLVSLGYLTDDNDEDLIGLANFTSYMASVVNTDCWQGADAEIIDLGFCSNYTKNSTEYWQCHVEATSASLWHYCGTAAMGSVVDSKLMVDGVSNLRVVDASVLPTIPASKIQAPIIAVAEKASDMIIEKAEIDYNTVE